MKSTCIVMYFKCFRPKQPSSDSDSSQYIVDCNQHNDFVSLFTFSIKYYIGPKTDLEILMDLHVLRASEYKKKSFLACRLCVCLCVCLFDCVCLSVCLSVDTIIKKNN